MKKYIFNGLMALRNLVRNSRRTVSTLLAILIGLIGLTFLDGYISYSLWGLKETIIHSGTGHIQGVLRREFFDEGDADPFPYMFENYKKIAKELRKNPAVKDVLAGIGTLGLASTHQKNESVMIKALPGAQTDHTLTFRNLVVGKDLEPGVSGQVLLGQGLAEKLDLVPGGTFTLFTSTSGGGVNNRTFTVAGLVRSGMAAYDGVSVFMDLKDAQDLLQSPGVSQLFIFLEQTKDTQGMMEVLKRHPPASAPSGMVFESWDNLSPYYQEAAGSYQMVLTVARLIVLLVALLSISGALGLTVLERLKEVGTLRSFGTKRRGIIMIFLWEGLIIGALGGTLGSLTAWGLTVLVNSGGGFVMPPQPGMTQALTIFFKPNLENFFQNGVLVFVAAGMGSFLPGLAAAYRNPAALLRSN